MIYLKDIKKNKIFQLPNLEASYLFCDTYNNPGHLTEINRIYCDGSGFNGKTSAYCYGPKENLKLIITSESLTNNVAEYSAILKAVQSSEVFDWITTDSLLCVNQIKGIYKTNNSKLLFLKEKCRVLIYRKKLTLTWTKRNSNYAGIHIDKVYKKLKLK